MKRSEALAEIRHCGYVNDIKQAAVITAQKGVGKAASRKAFLDGRRLADWGDSCNCPKCAKKR